MLFSSTFNNERNIGEGCCPLPYLVKNNEGVTIAIRLQPQAGRTAIAGLYEGAEGARLKIAVKAPPEDGKANDELCRFLAKQLKVPQKSVSVIQGHKARNKVVLVAGIGMAEISNKIEHLS